MSWLSRVGAWFSPRAKLAAQDVAYSRFSLPAYSAGVYVTTDTALQVSAVYGCVSRIANAIAPHPWEVHEVTARRRENRPDDAIAYLLNKRPNPSTTAVAFRQAMLRANAAGDGNSYAEIQKDNAGRPIALWPIEPDRVVPHTETDGTLWYRVYQYAGGQVDVDASRIYHLRGLASANGLVGDSTVYRASLAIAIASAAQQYAAAYYANGTISSGVLKHPKRVDPKTIDRLRREWLENHTGPAAAHKPLFLEEGMEWASISVDAEKSQLHETRSFAVEEVARFFGVPLHLLGVAQSAQGYGTNISQLGLEFRRYTLEPWVAALQQEADIKLFPQRAPWRETRIDLSALTRGDDKTEAETLVILKRGGILNQNQCLEQLGYNTIGPKGDVYTVEGTLKTVEQLIEPPKPPEPKALPAPEREERLENPNAIAREAVVSLFSSVLDRYDRRIANRRADLERKLSPEAVQEGISGERERLRPWLVAESQTARELLARTFGGAGDAEAELLRAADAVDRGTKPRDAALALVSAMEAV